MQRSIEEQEFGAALIAAGHLVPLGVDGLYGRGGAFERLVLGVDALVARTHLGEAGEELFFPPLMARSTLHAAGYLERFPHLCGLVHGFTGDDAAALQLTGRVQSEAPYDELLGATDVTLIPAVCLPLYPTLTGSVPEGGRSFELSAYAFRREPSLDPARMQAFRQREKVRIGAPAEVMAWRAAWLERGLALLTGLGLEAVAVGATDPFFGRGGRLLKADQREHRHKFELVVVITDPARPTALASFNYHEDTFGRSFEINQADGEPAHTACLGFGLERVALALLRTHGLDPAAWPVSIREQLWP